MIMRTVLLFFHKHNNTMFHCLLVCLFVYLCAHLHSYYVPDTDVFQYLDEGRLIIKSMFSATQNPPIYPFIIYILEHILPITNPGVVGGTILNIMCLVITAALFWRLLKPIYGTTAIIPVLCFICNPLTIGINLQPTNLSLSLLLITFVYVLGKKHPYMSLGIVCVAFFVRMESFVAFIIPHIAKLTGRLRVLLIVLSILLATPCLLWLKESLYTENSYMKEVVERQREIPNIQFVINTFVSAPFNTESSSLLFAVASVLWICVGILFSARKGLVLPFLFSVYVLGYTLIHSFFPDSVIRYSYPTLPFVYALLFWPLCAKTSRRYVYFFKHAIPFLLFIGIVNNFLTQKNYFRDTRWYRSEKRLVAEWLTDSVKQNTLVYAYEPHVVGYYTHNDNVHFTWEFDNALFMKQFCSRQRDVIMVVDSDVEAQSFFYDYNMGIGFIREFQRSPIRDSFYMVSEVKMQNRWAKIYKRRTIPTTICNQQPHV